LKSAQQFVASPAPVVVCILTQQTDLSLLTALMHGPRVILSLSQRVLPDRGRDTFPLDFPCTGGS